MFFGENFRAKLTLLGLSQNQGNFNAKAQRGKGAKENMDYLFH